MRSENTQRAGQAVFLITGQVLAGLSDTIVPILLVRLVSPTEVGILSAVLLLYSVIAPVFSSAFPATLMYFLPPRAPAERRVIAAQVATVLMLSGVVVGVGFLGLGLVALLAPDWLASFTDRFVGGVSAIGPEGLKYLVLLCVMPIGDLPSRMLQNLLVIEGRARTAAAQGVAKSLGNAAATAIPILLGASLWWVVGSVAVFGLLYGACVPIYLRVLYGRRVSGRSPIGLRELFGFSIPLGLTDAVTVLYNRIDQLLIAGFFTAQTVAFYRTGAWQVPVVTTIAFSVGSVFTPHLRRLFSEGKAAQAISVWGEAIRKVSLVVVPFGLVFVVVAEELIEIVFTPEYSAAANVFRLYCLLVVGRVAAFGSVLVAAGRPTYALRAAIVSLVANVVFSVPLMLTVGFLGPAIGTVLAFIVHVVVYCWYIGRASQVPLSTVFPIRDYAAILVVGLAAAAPAVAVKLMAPLPAAARLVACAAVLLASFAALGTAVGRIRREDWRFLGSIVSGALWKTSKESKAMT